ncbi:hypothetical protein EC957_004177 [Mortierella hygrophila]|uniref:Galactose oxidase n=1 Tax=Mortierella hygrophila TaxID=979708 RepID=A0A9P6FK12_9FUNG|nr:hypothetical protein EC957_004177 [Mortierella hygrophila]
MQLSPSLSTAVLLLLRLPLFLTTTTTTITHVQAQEVPPTTGPAPTPTPPPPTGPYNPTPLYSVHSVFVEGGALYVHGGLPSVTGVSSGQTFSLDLSVAWKTSQPAFKQLSTGIPSSSITSALLQDKDSWILINGKQFIFYTIGKDQWNSPVTLTELNPTPGFPAVTDMSSGLVYFVNGFVVPGASTAAVGTIPMMMMLKKSTIGYAFSSMGTSTEFSIVDSGYASCWSTLRKSILLHGGLAGSPVAIYQKTLYEFNTTTTTFAFATINDNGEIPTARSGHCMVEAYDGTKIVLFGGVDQTSAGLSDIYILDVATLKWTAGKTGGAGVGRAYAACAVTNDRFVAWGGATRINGDFVAVAATNATVVYDFIQDKWITTFSPIRTNVTSPNPEPDPSTPLTPPAGESSSSSKGALIGGIAGGVVVLAAIAVFIFFCRRRSNRRKEKKEKKMSFSTFAAMPVVTAETSSSSDDSFPDQQQQQRSKTRETEKGDDEEQDESGKEKKPQDDGNDVITYVIGARAMPASPTESSFRNSGIIPQNRNYQPLQQLPSTQQPHQQPLQPLSPIQEQQQAYHAINGIPFPPPPATAANVSTGYTVPVLKFFNPTTNAPTSPTTTSLSANTPIPIPSSPVASVIPLPPPSMPQRPQSLLPGGFIAPRVVHPPTSSQPNEPSYTTLIPYFSPVASVSSHPTTSQHSQSTIPVNNSNNRAYTNDQYHDQQGKEELQRQQQQRPLPTVEYGASFSPALSYLATSSQWTGSQGSTLVAPPPSGPGIAPGAGNNPYSTFTPSPLTGAPTGPAPGGGNTFAAFTPSPLSSYSDNTEASNSLPYVPIVDSSNRSGDLQKIVDELGPSITPPRNPHGIQ